MSYILAIEPDAVQASLLRHALQDVISEKIIIVGAKETALAAIDRQVPDLVLFHALMPPLDDEHFVAYLCTLPDTRHVQVIRIPRLLAQTDRQASRLFGRLRKRVDRTSWSRCDPRVFAGDVAAYLARAHALKQERAGEQTDPLQASDRRRAFRWTQTDVPWLSSVQLAAGERADLLDISLSGALVRTPGRPHLVSIRGGGLEAWTRPGLRLHLSSGEQVQVTGEVVRCRPASSGDGLFYQVAFRFDQSADLFLPTLLLPCADDPWTRAMADAKIVGGPTLYLPQALNQWCQW